MGKKFGIAITALFLLVLFAPVQELWTGAGGFNDMFDGALAGIDFFDFQRVLFHNLWIIICIVAFIGLAIAWRRSDTDGEDK